MVRKAAWGAAGAGGEVRTRRRAASRWAPWRMCTRMSLRSSRASPTEDRRARGTARTAAGQARATAPRRVQSVLRLLDAVRLRCPHRRRRADRGARPSAGGSAAVSELLEWPKDVVINIDSTDYAFAAVLDDGRVIAWGDAYAASRSPTASDGDGQDRRARVVGATVCCAHRGRRRARVGLAVRGRRRPLGSEMAGKSSDIVATEFAFAALTADGAIVQRWGDENAGGALPARSLTSSSRRAR